MQYILATYRSRNVTIRAYNYLVKQGQNCALVSTPRGAKVGCGLSVKMDSYAYNGYANILSQGETFAGFFLVKVTLGGSSVTKL